MNLRQIINLNVSAVKGVLYFMKVLVYAGNGGSGGLRGCIKGFLSACYTRPYDKIFLLCTEGFFETIKGKLSDNITVIRENSCKMGLKECVLNKAYSKKIIEIIDEINPDIIFHMSNIIYKGTEKYINVVGMHNQLFVDLKQLKRQGLTKTTLSLLLQRHFALRSYKNADAVVFESGYSKQQAIDNGLTFKKGIVAKYGVLDSERIHKFISKNKLVNEINLLYISTIFPYKNHIELLKGLKLLKEQGYRFKLHLVGNGPQYYEEKLKSAILSLGLKKEIVLYSWVSHENIKNMIDKSDIFIYASSIETSGFGVMEAMVRGATILCNNESCMPEILGEGGLLFNVHDSKNTADMLKALIDSPELREALGRRAFEISKEYTWEKQCGILFDEFIKLTAS